MRLKKTGTGPFVPEYTHFDGQGSAIAATDAAGAVVWRESYRPFGEERLNPAGNADNTAYTGHLKDDATGLSYMQARYYDPAIGRFLSTDPIGYQDQLNLYAYVGNDPVNATDPDREAGVVAWVAKMGTGAARKGKAFFDKKHAIESRRRGENVIAANRQMAGQIERGAAKNSNDVKRECESACKKDPVLGVIGIQKGPPEQMVQNGFQGHGSRGRDAGCGDDCEDSPGVFLHKGWG